MQAVPTCLAWAPLTYGKTLLIESSRNLIALAMSLEHTQPLTWMHNWHKALPSVHIFTSPYFSAFRNKITDSLSQRSTIFQLSAPSSTKNICTWRNSGIEVFTKRCQDTPYFNIFNHKLKTYFLSRILMQSFTTLQFHFVDFLYCIAVPS